MCTDRAGGYIAADVLVQKQPPETLFDEGLGAFGSWMAGQSEGLSLLQQLGMDGIGEHKQINSHWGSYWT